MRSGVVYYRPVAFGLNETVETGSNGRIVIPPSWDAFPAGRNHRGNGRFRFSPDNVRGRMSD